MYRHAPGQVFAAGHDGAGIPAAATRWFVAEGATGFFDEYVLVANGEANAADLTVTYLIEGAEPLVDRITVAAHSRRTDRPEGCMPSWPRSPCPSSSNRPTACRSRSNG